MKLFLIVLLISATSNAEVRISTPKKQITKQIEYKKPILIKSNTPTYNYFVGDIPKVLTKNDIKLYKDMFRLQRAKKRSVVVQKVPKLENRLLMGHLIAERILHPSTKTPYSDTKKWLDRYSDLSPAPQIYRLANKKKPRQVKHQHKKPNIMKASMARYSDPDIMSNIVPEATFDKKRKRLLNKLKYYRKKGYYTKAMKTLAADGNIKLLTIETWAQVATKLARHMLYDDYPAKAQAMAQIVVAGLDSPQPEALWIAGFASYQQGDKKTSAKHFTRLAKLVPQNSKYYARASWWAARSLEKLGKKWEAKKYIKMASLDPYSMYGQLAMERLGYTGNFTWKEPKINPKDRDFLFKHEGIRRVIALVQIGEHGLAQNELKTVYKNIPYDMDESLLAFSTKLQLPNTSMTLAHNLLERNKVYLSGLYPVTHAWQPRGGILMDPAMLHAIIRQESAFNPTIISRAGARGLMQLMPATARYIRQKEQKHPFSKYSLSKPDINMMLGQGYLRYLDNQFSGNLLYIVSAYNAGPGSVRKWVDKGMASQDPVLFIEKIPFKETRKYVRKVMANLWMYQKRMEIGTSTLTAMAFNRWPTQVAALKIGKNDG